MIATRSLFVAALCAAALGCPQESRNELGRSIQNWTGTDGILDVYAGEKRAAPARSRRARCDRGP